MVLIDSNGAVVRFDARSGDLDVLAENVASVIIMERVTFLWTNSVGETSDLVVLDDEWGDPRVALRGVRHSLPTLLNVFEFFLIAGEEDDLATYRVDLKTGTADVVVPEAISAVARAGDAVLLDSGDSQWVHVRGTTYFVHAGILENASFPITPASRGLLFTTTVDEPERGSYWLPFR